MNIEVCYREKKVQSFSYNSNNGSLVTLLCLVEVNKCPGNINT